MIVIAALLHFFINLFMTFFPREVQILGKKGKVSEIVQSQQIFLVTHSFFLELFGAIFLLLVTVAKKMELAPN